MADESKTQLKELKKISEHLAKLNRNDATIKEITKKEFELNKKDSVRAFKESLKTSTKEEQAEKTIKSTVSPLTSIIKKTWGAFDIALLTSSFLSIDDLEPLNVTQIAIQGRILEQTLTTSLWLRDIFFIQGNMLANIEKMTDHFTDAATFEFSQRRMGEENQRIQTERNRILEEQTLKLGELLEPKQAVLEQGEEKKGFFGKIFDKLGGIPTKIGAAFASIFAFFKLGSLIAFFKNLKVVKLLTSAFTKSGGILGMILKGVFGAIGAVFAVAGGFNIGTRIADWIDEKIGLGKGGIGKWLFDIIHSEEGFFGTIWNMLGDFATVLKDSIMGFFTDLPAIWAEVKNTMAEVGAGITSFLSNIGIWEFFEPAVTAFSELYSTFEPDLIRFKDTIMGFFTKIGDTIGNTAFDIVTFFSNLIDGIIRVKDDIVNKLIEVKDRIASFIKDPIGFIKNLLSDEVVPEDVSSEINARGALLLKQMREREKLEAIKNKNITDLAKNEALRAKIVQPVLQGQTTINSAISQNTTVIAPSDMGTDSDEYTMKQLQFNNR